MKKKKILVLIGTLDLGGSQTYALTVSKELIRKGHDVHIAAKAGPLSDMSDKLRIKSHSLRVDAGFHYTSDCLMKYYAKFVLLFMKSAISLLFLCKRERFDVIISQQPAPTFLALIMSKIFRVPVLYIVHHTLPNEFPPLFYNCFRYRLPAMIAISQEIRDYLTTTWGLDKSTITVIINCIDMEEYNSASDNHQDLASLNTRPKRVVYVSTITDSKRKAIENFVRAAAIVFEVNQDISFEIIGEGNIFDDIKLLVRKTNEAIGKDILKLLGGQADVKSVLKGASVFVGIARCAREAMALGIPTILVGHLTGKNGGNYGGIIDQHNVEEMEYFNLSGRNSATLATPEIIAADVVKLLSEHAYAEEVSRFGRKYVRNKCSSIPICHEIECEIDKLIKR